MASLWEPDPSNMPQDLTQYLLACQVVTPDQVHAARLEAEEQGVSIESSLVAMGFVGECEVVEATCVVSGVAQVDLSKVEFDRSLWSLFSKEDLRVNGVLPLSMADRTLRLGVVDVFDLRAVDFVKQKIGGVDKIELLVMVPSQFSNVLEVHFPDNDNPVSRGQGVGQQAEQVAVVKMVDEYIHEAVMCGVSDIHLEPQSSHALIRYRHDGVLRIVHTLHRSLWSLVCVRIKVLAGMDIAESRRPQDGRFEKDCGGRQVHFRVSSHPTVHGESLVVRVLDPSKALLDLNELGFSEEVLLQIRKVLDLPEGLVVMTGPTGSGKSTTLYAMIQEVSRPSLNIMTLEDPVEYRVSHIRQTQVREPLTFADGMRSVLRQDPDVILVGEVRDEATARMVIRAAMTGHKVFATVHASHPLGVFARMDDLGVGQGLLADHLLAIFAQRLVRKLCEFCKNEKDSSTACSACLQTGYLGRVALGEVVRLTPELCALISGGASMMQLTSYLKAEGHRDLKQEAVGYIRQRITSLAEVRRHLTLEDI